MTGSAVPVLDVCRMKKNYLKERGSGRGAASREKGVGGFKGQGVQLSATQSSFYMVIYMQLSATHELQSATQKH